MMCSSWIIQESVKVVLVVLNQDDADGKNK